MHLMSRNKRIDVVVQISVALARPKLPSPPHTVGGVEIAGGHRPQEGRVRYAVGARFAGQHPAAFDIPTREGGIGLAGARVAAADAVPEVFTLEQERTVADRGFDTGAVSGFGVDV